MLKRIFTASLLSCFLISTTFAADFADVPKTNDHYIAINYLVEQKIAKGYENNNFKPDQLVNRAEALKFIFLGSKVSIPEKLEGENFKDVKASDWFSKYVQQGKNLKIVSGNPDGTFAPSRDISRAEFIKMLLMSNAFKTDQWVNKNLFKDVPKTAWFAPYMNYAGNAGIVTKDAANNLHPDQKITRGEVAEILYLITIIRNGKDSKFLLAQAESQLAGVDTYLAESNVKAGKHASALAVDMTQQAYKNLPTNNTVLSAAKLARAYDFLVNAFIAGVEKKYDVSKDWANQAIAKATEGWKADSNSQKVAKHIKDRAAEIINQIPKN